MSDQSLARVEALAKGLFPGRRMRVEPGPTGTRFFCIEGDVSNNADWDTVVAMHARLNGEADDIHIVLEGGGWDE